MRRDIAQELVDSAKAMISGIPEEEIDTHMRNLINRLDESTKKAEDWLKKPVREINETNSFVVYGELGQPLAYVIPADKKITNTMQKKITTMFKAKENAETVIQWREVV
jgi:hypothetical protein